MFLSNQTRLKIQEIIKRISLDKEVSLSERLFVEKHAKHSSTVWTWLRKGNSLRRYGRQNQESINGLIQSLGLDGLDSESHFDPRNDDIADWFSGSPDWEDKLNYEVNRSFMFNLYQILESGMSEVVGITMVFAFLVGVILAAMFTADKGNTKNLYTKTTR